MPQDRSNRSRTPELSRRRMLMRLGIAATVAYAAPVLTGLSSASASSFSVSSFSRGRRRRRNSPRGRRRLST